MYLIIGGIHPPEITENFRAELLTQISNSGVSPPECVIFPSKQHPGYSPLHVLQFMHQRLCSRNPNHCLRTPIVLIGFSAGVVGAIGAAWGWQLLGGQIKALVALDGWGVPLGGNFPIHRISHDYFTHWSSAVLGAGEDSFYANPSVEHLELWRSPNTVSGLHIPPNNKHPIPTTAAQFIATLIQRYEVESK